MAFHCRKLEHTSHGAQSVCAACKITFVIVFIIPEHISSRIARDMYVCLERNEDRTRQVDLQTRMPKSSLHATSCDSHIAPMQGKAGDQETHGRTERTQTRNWASMKVSVFTICTALQYCTQTQI